MRRALVLLVAALVLLSAVQAADCTSAQIAELSTLQSNVTTTCGSDALSSATTTSAAAFCSDSTCLALLTSLLPSVPSCEVSSYNLRSVLTTAVASCDAASDAVPAQKSLAQLAVYPQMWSVVPAVVAAASTALALI